MKFLRTQNETNNSNFLLQLENQYGIEVIDPNHSCLYTAKRTCLALKEYHPRIICLKIYIDPKDFESEGHAYVVTDLHTPNDEPLNRRHGDDFTIEWLKAQDIEDITESTLNTNDSRL